jgi:hypothetical protein
MPVRVIANGPDEPKPVDSVGLVGPAVVAVTVAALEFDATT